MPQPTDREARLAAALRANLRRRKAQGRQSPPEINGEGEAAGAADGDGAPPAAAPTTDEDTPQR